MRICTHEIARGQLQAEYPKAIFKYYGSGAKTLAGYLEGDCDCLTMTTLSVRAHTPLSLGPGSFFRVGAPAPPFQVHNRPPSSRVT